MVFGEYQHRAPTRHAADRSALAEYRTDDRSWRLSSCPRVGTWAASAAAADERFVSSRPPRLVSTRASHVRRRNPRCINRFPAVCAVCVVPLSNRSVLKRLSVCLSVCLSICEPVESREGRLEKKRGGDYRLQRAGRTGGGGPDRAGSGLRQAGAGGGADRRRRARQAGAGRTGGGGADRRRRAGQAGADPDRRGRPGTGGGGGPGQAEEAARDRRGRAGQAGAGSGPRPGYLSCSRLPALQRHVTGMFDRLQLRQQGEPGRRLVMSGMDWAGLDWTGPGWTWLGGAGRG